MVPFKGVWILSVPTVYIKYFYIHILFMWSQNIRSWNKIRSLFQFKFIFKVYYSSGFLICQVALLLLTKTENWN